MSENPETITFNLSTPVEHDGQKFNTLTFREAKTGDMVALDAFEGPIAKTVALMAGMADVSVPFMKKVSARDFERMAVAIAPLLPQAPVPDGSTSSR